MYHTMRLPKALEERLNVLTESTKRSKISCVHDELKRMVHDIEDASIAEQAYELFITSGEPAISLQDVEKKIALAD